MKALPWILVVLLGGLLLWSWFRPSESVPAKFRIDTVYSSSVTVRRDTVPHYLPMPLLCWHTGDTIHVGDSVLPVEQKIYRDSDYTAYVSGYRPQMDSISVFPKTVIVTNDIYHTFKDKPRRWGLGITAGYGFSKDGLSPAVVVGVNYRIW